MPEPGTPLAERPWEDVGRLLDVESALARVLAAFAPTPAVALPLLEAAGLALAEDIVARDNVPPFRNSAMDGFAVRAADTASATWERPVALRVIAEVAAGQGEARRIAAGEAIRIMTGAPLPAGADAVVRFEETDEAASHSGGSRSCVQVCRPARPFDNVREAGEDITAGAVVARRGRALRAPDLGLIASVGHAAVSVHRRPVVGILSTGNELVGAGRALPPGAIRDSNASVLGALAQRWGARVQPLGIARDTVEDLVARLRGAMAVDLLVTSGGVSLGDYDVVKDVLKAEGEVAVWQVRMKPGKPLAFGQVRGTPLLGLPGNPVAAAVSFLLFGRPAIRKMLGYDDLEPAMVDVVAGDALDNRGQRRHYVRVRLERRADGEIVAWSVGEQGAGVLSSLAAADALLVVPESLAQVEPGMRLRAIPLDC
jgi:molybdopterin molybdotransferase